MEYNLGINTGFAVNRYQEPEEWCEIVKNIGLNNVQLTADLINVSLPQKIIIKKAKEINKYKRKNRIEITSLFTGAFTRVNHLANPDKDIRKYWINWFKNFIDLSLFLECKIIGSHFGILTIKEYHNKKIREKRFSDNLSGWEEIANYALKKGVEQILWEPMSIGREYGHTIRNTRLIDKKINSISAVPFNLCLDVDHGDISSRNPKDTNPYEWIKEFKNKVRVLHVKQSLKDKSGHFPFTKKFNKIGKIVPDKIIKTLKKNNIKNCDIILELSFREREPADSTVEKVLRESVDYWIKSLG